MGNALFHAWEINSDCAFRPLQTQINALTSIQYSCTIPLVIDFTAAIDKPSCYLVCVSANVKINNSKHERASYKLYIYEKDNRITMNNETEAFFPERLKNKAMEQTNLQILIE